MTKPLALTLAAAALTLAAHPGSAHAATNPRPVVDNSTRAGALAAYRTHHEAAKAVATGWNGNAATCAQGTPTADAQTATLTTINYYRSMVGLAPVSFNTTWNASAQRAALMMLANGAVSHAPPSTWRCWTAAGAAAAKSGNIVNATATGAAAIDSYVDDYGNDATVAHRRWLFDPRLTTMGNGQTSSTNVLKLWDGALPAANPAGTPAVVAWPDSGYVPKTLVRPGMRWSLTVMDPAVDVSAATVKVTSKGAAIPVTVARLTAGYGRPTVGFTPTTGYTGGSDRPYTVTVAGLKKAGVALPARTWTTTLFDPAYALSPQSVAWTGAVSGTAGTKATLTASATSGLPVTYTSTTPAVCTTSGATVTYLTAGRCTVRATQAGNTTWTTASALRTMYVGSPTKAANVITWVQPAPGAAGGTATLAATASSRLAVTYSSSTPSVCTVSGTTVRYVGGGTCTVTATQAGSTTVNEAVPVARSWAVTGAKYNAITWNPPTSVTVGQTVPRNPVATSGSGVFGYGMSMSAAGVCGFGSGVITFGAPGTCTVTVTQGAANGYAAASVTRTITVR